MHHLIIIGCGRSGSTFLASLFQADGRCAFHGETDFLVPRLWEQAWSNRFWFNWKLFTASNPSSSRSKRNPDRIPDLRHELELDISVEQEESAKRNVGAGVRKLMYELLPFDPHVHKVWGYKEIWNGAAWSWFDWACYDYVFPEARWLTVVRHPLSFALSAASWNRDLFSQEYLKARFQDWLAILMHSRARRCSPYYHEIRLEDLVCNSKAVLTPVLEAVDLTWSGSLQRAVDDGPVLRSSHRQTMSLSWDEVAATIDEVNGLGQAMSSLNYGLEPT